MHVLSRSHKVSDARQKLKDPCKIFDPCQKFIEDQLQNFYRPTQPTRPTQFCWPAHPCDPHYSRAQAIQKT